MSNITEFDRILQSKVNGAFIQHAVTDFEPCKTNLCWDIKKFISMKECGDTLIFSKTVTLIKHSCECDLQLTVNAECDAKNTGNRKNLLKIKLYSFDGRGARLLVTVVVRDIKSQALLFKSEKKSWDPINSSEKILNFELPTKIQPTPYHSYSQPPAQFFPRDSVASDGTLTIHIFFEEIIESKQIRNQSLNSHKELLLDFKIFAELYEKKLLVDVTFTMPDKRILHAHSIVLAVICPYFLSMFTTSNMKEQKTRNVDLSSDTNISYDVFKGFLDYVYGVKAIKDLQNMIMDLAILADKYNCSQLHRECESILCDSLHISKLASLLLFAHQHNFQSLKQKVLETTRTHGMKVLKDLDGFDEVCKNPKLLKELISSL